MIRSTPSQFEYFAALLMILSVFQVSVLLRDPMIQWQGRVIIVFWR